jgi:hypothetical protein
MSTSMLQKAEAEDSQCAGMERRELKLPLFSPTHSGDHRHIQAQTTLRYTLSP